MSCYNISTDLVFNQHWLSMSLLVLYLQGVRKKSIFNFEGRYLEFSFNKIYQVCTNITPS